MDLLRAAFLLESEMAEIDGLPVWRRRDLDNIARASIRAMREAAERIQELESAQPSRQSTFASVSGDDHLNPPLAPRAVLSGARGRV